LSLAQCCLRTPARVDSRCETLERQVKECRQGRVAYQRVPGRRRSVCVDGDCCAASITPAGAPLAQFFSTTRKCKAPRHCSTRAQREDETQWQQDAHTDRYTHTHTHTHTRTHARTHTHACTDLVLPTLEIIGAVLPARIQEADKPTTDETTTVSRHRHASQAPSRTHES
jgi:hypothetical protein